MDIKQHLQLLQRWSWFILLCALICGGISYGLISYLPASYEASVRLLVFQAPASSGTDDYTEILTSDRMVRSYAEALQARPIREATISKLALNVDAEELAEQLTVQIIRETQVMVLTVTSHNPHEAATIANTIVQLFVEQHYDLTKELYRDSRTYLQDELDAIQTEITATQERMRNLGDVRTFLEQAEYDRIQMLLWQYRSEYSAVFRSLENVLMAEAQSTDTMHVIEPAVVPEEAAGPQPVLLAVLAMMAGGFVAATSVTLRDYLDESIRRPAQLDALGARPLLATIPRGGDPLEPSPAVRQAFELLAARLTLLREHPPQSILVTSSGPGEGKSNVALNLARSLAQSGRQVVLIDAMLRHPQLHEWFGLKAAPGLAELLADTSADLAAVLQTTDTTGLQLLPAGSACEQVPQLLSSARLLEIMAELSDRFDLIVIDGPALQPLVDTLLLARMADAVLLVVRSKVTQRQALVEAQQRLAESGAATAGIVLTNGYSRRRPHQAMPKAAERALERPNEHRRIADIEAH